MGLRTPLAGAIVSIIIAFAATSVARAENDTINIAHSGPLSGPYSEFGVGKQHGVELAIDKWNKTGGINGKQILLRYNLDDQLVPDRAIQNHRRILDDASIVGIIAPGGSSVMLALRPMLVADGRPVMNAQAQAPAIVYPEGEDSLPYKNIFSTAIQNDTEADVIGMGVSKKYAKIGILHENTGYGSTGAELIKKSILKARPEASIAIESYNLKAQDMTAQVARLKSAGVDVVVVVGLGADMAVARKNIQRLNWAPAVYASAGGLTPAYAQGAGDLVVGTRAPMLAAFAQPLLTPEAREFADAYFAKYGADRWWGDNKERPQITISLTVANAYDAANLLFEAIRRAGSNDREAVIAQLNKIDGYKGVNAVYSLSEKNHTGVKPQDLGFFEYVKEGDQLTFKLVND